MQLSRVVACDPDAWEALYRDVYPGLHAFASRRLGSAAAADDAVSEAMARALDRVGSFSPRGGGLRAWLYGILRNVILESYRTSGRTESSVDLDRASSDPEPGSRLIDLESRDHMRLAFARLEPADREVLELRVVARLSADDVGQVLDKQAGAVRMAQSRALERLRVALKEVTGGD